MFTQELQGMGSGNIYVYLHNWERKKWWELALEWEKGREDDRAHALYAHMQG